MAVHGPVELSLDSTAAGGCASAVGHTAYAVPDGRVVVGSAARLSTLAHSHHRWGVDSLLTDIADGAVTETVPREALWAAQTPQAFDLVLLRRAYESTDPATDDAQLVERLGQRVAVVEGSPQNLKITTKDDLKLAELILRSRERPKPDGPAHPFEDDDLWR